MMNSEQPRNSYPNPMPEIHTQPELPLAVHSDRYVDWIQVTLSSRRRLLGRKTTMQVVTRPDTPIPEYTKIQSDSISELADPQLRAALQLQDAARSAGWLEHSPGFKSAQAVTVYAVENGTESTFVSAQFTGKIVDGIDTFMEHLQNTGNDFAKERES